MQSTLTGIDAARQLALQAIARVIDLEGNIRETRFPEREQQTLSIANDLVRRLLEADLQRVADSMPDEVVVRGHRYRRHEPGEVAYHSLCGDLIVRRHSYRRADVRNGPCIVPMDLAAGLIDAATPALAQSIAHGIAEMPSRRYEEVLRAAHRVPPSRSTIERLAQLIGSEVKDDSLLLEAMLRVEERVPDGANAISIGLDRTSVPMAED